MRENTNDHKASVPPPEKRGGIIYNVTTKVDPSIATEWLRWIRGEHIPEMKATGCFYDAVVSQLLETDDTDGPTYAVQYFAESKAVYNLYIEKSAAGMRQKAFDKWGSKFISFRSLMKVVN